MAGRPSYVETMHECRPVLSTSLDCAASQAALAALRLTATIEVALGAVVVALVSVFGLLEPG